MTNVADWLTLDILRPGALFETRTGTRAVKTEYHYPNGQCQCVLLASGEYAHFKDGNATEVREIVVDDHLAIKSELELTREVLNRLVLYFGSARVSLGKEGYIALEMARDVVTECINGTWGEWENR